MANIEKEYKNAYGTKKINGKDYTVFDINNLKESNALMNEYIKKQEKIIANGKKISTQNRQVMESHKKQVAANQEIINTWNKYITQTTKDNFTNPDVIKKIMENTNKDSSKQKMPNNIADIIRTTYSNSVSKKQEAELSKIYEKVAGNVTRNYKRSKADFSDPEVINKMNAEIQEKTGAEFSKSVSKFGKHSEIINVAIDTFKKAVDTWVGVFKLGMDKQSNTFEETFTNISVRGGVTRSNYYDAQLKLNNRLREMGLRNNIGSSEVQMAWDKMATNGIKIDMHDEESRAKISAKAIENVLTNNIVPYLDTNTAQWDQLISAQPELQKNIRGINRLNNELVGNNYATQELVQSILDDLQPISDSALNDLAMSAAGATSFINSMMANGMDEATAKSLWTEYYKEQQYGAQILRTGSVSEKMALTNAMTNGINLYDSSQTGYGLANIARTKAMGVSWGTGYGNTVSGVTQSAVNDALGINPNFAMWSYTKGKDVNNIIDNALNISNKAMNEIDKYGNLATEEFKNDQNQTNKKLQDITVENMANEFAFLNEWMGNWAGVIETAIKGIGLILTTKIIGGVIGKGIGALSGISGALPSVGGLGAALAPLLPIAAGVGVAALAASKIAEKRVANAENYGSSYNNLYNQSVANQIESGVSEDNVDTIQAMVDASSGLGKSGAGEVWGKGRYIETMGGYPKDLQSGNLGTPAGVNSMLDIFDWVSTDTKNKYNIQFRALRRLGSKEAKLTLDNMAATGDNMGYNKIKTFALASVLSSNADRFPGTSVVAAINADLLLHSLSKDEAITTPLSEILNLPIIEDKETLKKFMQKANITEAKDLKLIYDLFRLNTIDYYLRSSGGNYHEYPSEEELKSEFNLHRYGLNRVPYDEYPALLHKDETILSATTANTLRDLVSEYQQVSTQNINFDNIIQQQTNDLISKLNEIINVIGGRQDSSFSNTLRQIEGNKRLLGSMKYMESTKSY